MGLICSVVQEGFRCTVGSVCELAANTDVAGLAAGVFLGVDG